MGFMTYMANHMLSQGKALITGARSAGKSVLRDVGRAAQFVEDHQGVFEGIGGVASAVAGGAAALGTGNIAGAASAAQAGVASAKRISSVWRKAGVSRKRKRPTAANSGDTSVESSEAQFQPSISGDAMESLLKRARPS